MNLIQVIQLKIERIKINHDNEWNMASILNHEIIGKMFYKLCTDASNGMSACSVKKKFNDQPIKLK